MISKTPHAERKDYMKTAWIFLKENPIMMFFAGVALFLAILAAPLLAF